MAKVVPSGQGKGWAKGRTALTDPRVARNAEARRGMTYQRHLAPEHDRRHRHGGTRTLPLEWSETMAYVVGLIATDGCLINTGRHLSFDSADEELVRTFLGCLGRPIVYRTIRTRAGGIYYKAEFSDVRFYRWLEGVGLTQRKSLTLGRIDVPDRYLFSTLRGLFDGDGSLQNFVHRPTLKTYADYTYERLWVFFSSASRSHLEWISAKTQEFLGFSGYLELRRAEGRHDFFRLKFGKYESIDLLRRLYLSDDVPKLERKWKVWDDYARRNGLR